MVGTPTRQHSGTQRQLPCESAKAYIFRHRDKTHAWVGSNNLTKSAFRNNDELALETSDKTDIEALEAWFEDRWKGTAARKVRPFSLIDHTLIGLSSGGATVDCDFKTAYVKVPNAGSFYWSTLQLCDETIRREATGQAEGLDRANLLEELTELSVPQDAVTDDPILGTVELRH